VSTALRARSDTWQSRQLSKLALLALVAGAAVACSDATPELGAIPSFPLPDAEQATQIVVEATPELVEVLSAVQDPTPPVEIPRSPAALSNRSSTRAKARAAQAAPAESYVPLESLLRAPHASGSTAAPLDLGALSQPSVSSGPPTPPGVLDDWKQRVRVARRSEPIGRAGAKQGTLSQTDVSLRIPVDQSVSLEGGVRVDQRDEPADEEPVRKSIPRVGVEVRF
jgi:hypothetical protein